MAPGDRPAGLPHGFDLDDLDAERPHLSLTARANGQLIALRDPRNLSWRQVAAATSNWWAFTEVIVAADGRRAVGRLPQYQMGHLVRTYRTHYGLCRTPAEDHRLAGLIARYGKAIEQDLTVRQVDMLALWQHRRWRHLLTMIDALPRNSAYVEALADDDDLAEQLLQQPSPAGRARPLMSQYSPELEMATNTFDRLGELIQAVTAAAGAKPPKITPSPRPRTAADRIRQRRAQVQHRRLVARLLPHGTQPTPPRPSQPRTAPAAGDPLPRAAP